MRINHRKIGGLHFFRFGRIQLSYCLVRSLDSTRSPHTTRASHASLDSSPRVSTRDFNAAQRMTRFLHSPAMHEAREVEWWLMRIIVLPVVFIWSVTLIEAADRFGLF